MAQEIDDLIAADAELDLDVEAALAFIAGVPALIDAAVKAQEAGDLAALPALSADIAAKAAALKAAVAPPTPPAP